MYIFVGIVYFYIISKILIYIYFYYLNCVHTSLLKYKMWLLIVLVLDYTSVVLGYTSVVLGYTIVVLGYIYWVLGKTSTGITLEEPCAKRPLNFLKGPF